MSDDTLWVSDHLGRKATIPAADRDLWKLHGWAEAGEPADGDFVWMDHPDDGITQPGLVAYAARDYWEGIGWRPSVPPEPVNPAVDPVLTDALREKTPARPVGEPKKTITSGAKSATKSEE